MPFRRRSARWAACAVATGLTLCATVAHAQNYPRLGMGIMIYNDGYPLYGADGLPDLTAFQQFARYDELILHPSPFLPYRPEGLDLLKSMQPQIRLLGYHTGHYIWYAAAEDSLVNFPTRVYRTVRDLDGFLYNVLGAQFGLSTGQFGNVNMAKRDFLGRFVVAEALADLYYDAVLRPGKFDGMFIDTFCDDIEWMQSPGEIIDYQRAGYPDFASFKVAWKAGTDTLGNRLRRLAGPAPILVGNCGQGSKYASFNGWMREDFPNQNGGTWFSNMFRDPGGYLLDDQRFREPQHNFMYSISVGIGTPYLPENTRKVRLGLASAALGEGYHIFGVAGTMPRVDPFHTWWYDEYSVDLTTGRAASDRAHTGWLGQPLGAPYQMMWLTAGPDGVSNPGFESSVTSGWQLSSADAAAVARDASTAAVGAASARVTIPVADPTQPWRTSFTTTSTIAGAAGQSFSATFWARASQMRIARVALAGPGESSSVPFTLGTTWQRYQVVLTRASTGSSTLMFQLANAAGQVWLDDVHVQAGVNSLYRRDFQEGTVLVNPGATAQTVVLERPFRRILGVSDPVANDGVEAASVTVPAMDARFLIGSDQIPPSAVLDMRPVPPTPAAQRPAP